MLNQNIMQSFEESLVPKPAPDNDGEPEGTPPPPPPRSNNRPAPAVFTAGRRRRRVARELALPRSGTAPHMTSESQNASIGVALYPTIATGQSVMDTPTKPPLTPALSASATLTPTAHGKRKGHSLLDKFKSSKEHNDSDDSQKPVPTTPFADDALKSPKVVRLLGLSSAADSVAQTPGSVASGDEDEDVFGEGSAQSNSLSPTGPVDGDRGPGVRKILRKSPSLSWLTGKQGAAITDRQTKFKEEDIGPTTSSGPAAASTSNLKFWKKDPNKKAFKNQMLGFITSRPKTAGRDTDGSSQDEGSQDTDIEYHSDGDLGSQPRRLWSDELAKRGKRNQKKKHPKTLQRMSPISEAFSPPPQDDYAYHTAGGDHDTELDYGRPRRDGASPGVIAMTRSSTTSLIPRIKVSRADAQDYGELQDEPYSTQDNKQHADRYGAHEFGRETEQRKPRQGVEQVSSTSARPTYDLFGEHPTSNLFDHSPPVLAAKSRLQEMERVLLANTEERMKMDAEVDRLQKEHRKLKQDFHDIKRRNIIGVTKDNEDKSNCGDSDTGSIEYGTDEEVEICTAKPVSVMRVTPGMVKVVDIPPRKKAPAAQSPEQSPQNQGPGYVKGRYKHHPKHPSYYQNQAKWEPLAPVPVLGGEEHGLAPPVPPKDPKRSVERKREGDGGKV